MRDYEDGGRQPHHGGDQHRAPQGAVENLLAHQERQLDQQRISPGPESQMSKLSRAQHDIAYLGATKAVVLWWC